MSVKSQAFFIFIELLYREADLKFNVVNLLLASTAIKREKFAKNKKKYFKGKVVIFTVETLTFQYPVDLLTFLELYFSSKYL